MTIFTSQNRVRRKCTVEEEKAAKRQVQPVKKNEEPSWLKPECTDGIDVCIGYRN